MAHMYRVNTAEGACHLVIDRLETAHAGSYTCQDFLAVGRPSSAQLVVLGELASASIAKH